MRASLPHFVSFCFIQKNLRQSEKTKCSTRLAEPFLSPPQPGNPHPPFFLKKDVKELNSDFYHPDFGKSHSFQCHCWYRTTCPLDCSCLLGFPELKDLCS